MSVSSAGGLRRGRVTWLRSPAILRLLSFLSALLSAQSWAAAADPAPTRPGACAEVAPCAKLAEEARLLSRREQLDAALVSYQRAYAFCNDPVLLFNLARIYHRMNRLTEARDHYQRYLTAAPDDEPTQRERAKQYLKSLTEDTPPKPATTPAATPGATVPVISAVPEAPKGPPPLYKKWWFWTAIAGGVLAATALGVGLGVAAQEPDFGGAPQYRPF